MELPNAVQKAKDTVKEINEKVKAEKAEEAAGGGAGAGGAEGGGSSEGISLEQKKGKETPLEKVRKERSISVKGLDEATELPGAGAGKKAGGEGDKDEHRYEVLKGKYDTEVPRLTNQVTELKTQVANLQQLVKDQNLLINKMAAAGESGAGEGGEGAGAGKGGGSAKEITKISKIDLESLGDYDEKVIEIADLLNKVIENNDAYRERETKLLNEIETLKSTTQETTSKVAQQVSNSFWSRVLDAVPNFKSYNGDEGGAGADPRWANFLNSHDPADMSQYRVKANEAIQSGNSAEFIRIVKIFEDLLGQAGESGAGGGGAGGEGDELEGQISHKKAGGGEGGAGGSGNSEVVTEEDMAVARTMLNAGKINTNEFRDILNRYHKTMTGQGK